MNGKNLEKLIRVLLAFIMWFLILAIIAITALVTATIGVMLPALLYWLPVLLGIFMTLIIGSNEGWENLKQNVMGNVVQSIDVGLREQLSELSEDELQAGLEKIEAAKVKFGLGKQKRKKKKRDVINERISALSDSDLMRIKTRLEDGTLEDDEIIAMLDKIDSQQHQG